MSWKDTIRDDVPATPAEKKGSWRDTITDDPKAEQAFGKNIDEDIERISKKYKIDPEELKSRQIGMGYYSDEEADNNVKAGNHLKHLGSAASATVNSVVGEGLLGGLPSWITKKMGDENEELATDELRRAVDHHKSGLQSASELVTSVAPAALAGKAIKTAQWAKELPKVAKAAEAGVNIVGSGLAGLAESDSGKELKDASIGGGIAAGIEAIPVVGKGIKAVKRLIPATEGAYPIVNKAAAKLAKIIPSQSASADDIERMFTETTKRRAARGTDMVEQAMELAPKLDDAKTGVRKGVDEAFAKLENTSLSTPSLREDLLAADDVLTRLSDENIFINQNERYFSKTTQKVSEDVLDIMIQGSPKEAGKVTYKKTFKEMAAVDEQQAAQMLRVRALHARRHVDDLMKNKNWDNLLSADQEAIVGIRSIIDDNLKTIFGGAEERLKADKIYSTSAKKVNELFKPLEQLDPNGLRNVEPQKLNNFLKSQGVRGSVFDKRLADFGTYLKKAESEIGKIPEAQEALRQLEKARDLGGMSRLVEDMSRAGGGPTSQAINTSMQLFAGYQSGGVSIPFQILLLPITNPKGWVDVVDSIGAPLHNAITKAANAIIKASPSTVTRIYMMSKEK